MRVRRRRPWPWLQSQLALRHLHARRREHLARYPQLACLAFEHHGITINVLGRDDREELEFLTTHLSRHIDGKTVCDAGAYIGNHTLAFAERAARVVAFEPNPVTYELLKLNCRDRANVVPLCLAASDRGGTAPAAVPRTNYGESRIAGTPAEGELALTFELVRLDDVALLATDRVGLLKIDVEGHEPQVLRGAERLLRRDRPLVVLEQHARAIDGGTSPSLDLLRAFGYRFFYSLERVTGWLVPQWVPSMARRPLRVVEALLLGVPEVTVELREVERLERRDYAMLVAAVESLSAISSSR
ncbi:MAG TPA: FkbM family methyltransferase [Thermoanaerobaculia bacterium]|jgi:FkbM family methyltransferase|nr:FkbM family methyltransferase [Thermoanaerobaculia bacterium]